MSRLQDVILRGTAAARPLANTVPNGTLYYSTDTAVTEQSDGTTWFNYSDAGAGTTAQKTRQIGVTVDGAGAAITTGVKGYKSFPVAGTITGVRMLADIAGSAVVDIWKDTYANHPPTVADTITAAAKPTISATTKSEDTALVGWTTSVSAGDVFGFNVDSASTITKLIVELTIVVS